MSAVRSPSAASWSRAAVVRALVAGVVAVDLFAFGMVGQALRLSRAQYRERAVVATQNLTAGLEQYLGGLFDKVDLALLAVADEYERALASGSLRDPAAFEAFLARQQRRVSDAEAFRIVDASGVVRYGPGLDPAAPTWVGDRLPFARLREDPGAGLVISRAMVGRISGRPEIVLGRAVRGPGGAFAGMAAAVISLEDIRRSFAAFDVGRSGVIVLRDDDLGVVLRHQPGGAPVATGSRTVSPELRAFVAEGRTRATYAGMPVDGVERILTFRRLARHPFYVIAGLAFDDYLGEWRREALVALAIATTFAALTAFAAAWGYRSWRRREAAVDALAQQETKFRLLAESASDLIWMIDRDLHLTYVSPAAQRILGYPPDEVMALPRETLFTPAELERLEALRAQVRSAAPRSQPFAGRLLEQELVHRDGRIVHAEAHLNVLWKPDGTVAGALGITRDVTEHREMRARVQMAERMASVGTLAAGVAHEVNNPLTYVLSNVAFALDRLRATEPEWSARPGAALGDAVQALAEALVGADRVRHIVRDLRTLSRAEGEKLGPVWVNAVVEGCLRMTAGLTGPRARVQQRLGEVPPVYASEARLAQVVLNLLVNAAQAIPEGRPAAHEISVATSRAADGRVEIEVRDTGAGISPDALPRIFDPFFTTKPVGEGTGLGLSICHGIVSALGGEIRVESELGRGTRFRVLLPPAPPPAPEPDDAARPEEDPAGRRRRVLVLDDDPLVARAISRMLSGGWTVDVLTAPREAVARISAGERWDVILCDLVMPELSGMDVHARVASIDAALAARMIFMTGGAFTASARDFLDRVPNARLDKPIDPAALERVLDAQQAA